MALQRLALSFLSYLGLPMSKASARPKIIREPPNPDIVKLTINEIWWRDHQKWLETKGYMLRPRYRPDWQPSWLTNGEYWYNCEDSRGLNRPYLLDATNVATGTIVQLKLIEHKNPEEADIARRFSSGSFSTNPKNHCVPILETLELENDPNFSLILVMPLLRDIRSPPFETVGELVECFRQVFEGVQLLHEEKVAHRDLAVQNIMMDASPIYPEGYHPHFALTNRRIDGTGDARHLSRTLAPVKYYVIDFGLAWDLDTTKGASSAPVIVGIDRTVPEFQGKGREDLCDPFPVDIYCLGNMVKTVFLDNFSPLDFMKGLVARMRDADPVKRPTMDTVVGEYNVILRSLGPIQLHARLRRRDEFFIVRLFRSGGHAVTTLKRAAASIPAVLVPKPHIMPPPAEPSKGKRSCLFVLPWSK